MAEHVLLSPTVAVAIIAFLLSLLPAGFFIWVWYLRSSDNKTVPAASMALTFLCGFLLVIPAFALQYWFERLWIVVSPSTAHYFFGAITPLMSMRDVVLPMIGTFLIVATIEEGLRYGVLRYWIRKSKHVDQVFDGLMIGIAIGLGFATLENTLYFLQLFQQGMFEELVFVFFLRFLVSTMAHISFGGLMGALIARGTFDLYQPRYYMTLAFFVPWLLHGLFDWFLGIQYGFYAVLLLLPPLFVLMYWASRRDFFIIYRKNGMLLANGEAPPSDTVTTFQKVLKHTHSPWNEKAPWMQESKLHRRILDVKEEGDL